MPWRDPAGTGRIAKRLFPCLGFFLFGEEEREVVTGHAAYAYTETVSLGSAERSCEPQFEVYKLFIAAQNHVMRGSFTPLSRYTSCVYHFIFQPPFPD